MIYIISIIHEVSYASRIFFFYFTVRKYRKLNYYTYHCMIYIKCSLTHMILYIKNSLIYNLKILFTHIVYI